MDINATLLVEMIIFLIFLTLTKRLVWGKIIEIIDERRAIIEKGLKQADHAKSQEEKSKEKIKILMNESSIKANQIIQDAQNEAQVLIDKAKESCQQKLVQNEKELEAMSKQIKKEAQSQIEKQMLVLATEICQKALSESIDSTVSRKMIEKQISEAA